MDLFTNGTHKDIVSLCKNISYVTPLQYNGVLPIWTPMKYDRKEVEEERKRRERLRQLSREGTPQYNCRIKW